MPTLPQLRAVFKAEWNIFGAPVGTFLFQAVLTHRGQTTQALGGETSSASAFLETFCAFYVFSSVGICRPWQAP